MPDQSNSIEEPNESHRSKQITISEKIHLSLIVMTPTVTCFFCACMVLVRHTSLSVWNRKRRLAQCLVVVSGSNLLTTKCTRYWKVSLIYKAGERKSVFYSLFMREIPWLLGRLAPHWFNWALNADCTCTFPTNFWFSAMTCWQHGMESPVTRLPFCCLGVGLRQRMCAKCRGCLLSLYLQRAS